MTGNLQPLEQKFPITKSDGTPTEYFIRWAQQRQIDIGEGITSEQAVEIITQYLADHMLQEGSGISLSPSGNISDSPTIAAEVQAILDQITNVQGSILFRGASGWDDLAAGTAGHFLKTNGASANPEWASAGGGGSVAWSDVGGWSQAVDGSQASWDVIGLAGANEILIVGTGITTSLSGNLSCRVSVNNGTSFFAAATDYQSIAANGTVTGQTVIANTSGSTTSARAPYFHINGNGVATAAPFGFSFGANITARFIGSTSPIDAIRILAGAGTMNAGSFRVLTR